MLKEALHRLVTYDPNTGIFTWNIDRSPKTKQGMVVGNKLNSGYLECTINYERYLLHRLAFLYMEGHLPEYVDHINGDKSDNRWCNLRQCTRTENQYNSKKQSNNKSGFKNVRYCNVTKKYVINISLKGRRFYQGGFDTAEEANEAAIFCRNIVHKTFARHD